LWGLVLLAVVIACGGDDEIQRYFDEIAPFMDAAIDAEEAVNRINVDQARVNVPDLSRTELTRMTEVSATATAKAFDKVSSSAAALHRVVPPTHAMLYRTLCMRPSRKASAVTCRSGPLSTNGFRDQDWHSHCRCDRLGR